MGSSNGIHTYGLAFVDPHLHFWSSEFPPLTPAEIAAGQLSLVCSSCKNIEKLDNTSIEAGIFVANKSILRFCKHCGFSTFGNPRQVLPRRSPSLPPRSKRRPHLPRPHHIRRKHQPSRRPPFTPSRAAPSSLCRRRRAFVPFLWTNLISTLLSNACATRINVPIVRWRGSFSIGAWLREVRRRHSSPDGGKTDPPLDTAREESAIYGRSA